MSRLVCKLVDFLHLAAAELWLRFWRHPPIPDDPPRPVPLPAQLCADYSEELAKPDAIDW